MLLVCRRMGHRRWFATGRSECSFQGLFTTYRRIPHDSRIWQIAKNGVGRFPRRIPIYWYFVNIDRGTPHSLKLSTRSIKFERNKVLEDNTWRPVNSWRFIHHLQLLSRFFRFPFFEEFQDFRHTFRLSSLLISEPPS
jgi:hypothetical protein